MESLKLIRTLISANNKFISEWKRLKRPVLGYTCSYTPEEIISAGEILPIRILGSLEPPKLADVHVSTNVCSFAKSCFNNALKGEYSSLDGYVFSHSCDNQKKIYDLWRRYTTIPKAYFINTPHSTNENSRRFFRDELEKFREWLMKSFKVEISEENLRSTIRTFNENRRLLRQVYDLRKGNPPLVLGSEALEIVLSSMMTPKEEHNKLLQVLLEEIDTREDVPKEGVRLLVSGSIMDNSELLRLIESVGGSVVADDLCTGSRYFWDLVNEEEEPMTAITERYLHKIPSSFMYSSEERFRHTREMAKLFDVEGVLIFSLKFCDVHSFDAPLLAEELREEDGLPVLCLEWDHSLSGTAQLRTRIEAFIEMLEEQI
ncbi:MAG: 2-hydroxyacyl-CoA dehydratase family protein [Candidatus Bathyarchaeota archaeon]|nr:2-hydroxyacyl-CoA dehydratase family protein [Candidatus Bathyarchaeota archaeon]MDH5787280.1 2-hydroxyacyl-CoA dehydratase family protein [Candidatus Bathyarchaeota archaeon]